MHPSSHTPCAKSSTSHAHKLMLPPHNLHKNLVMYCTVFIALLFLGTRAFATTATYAGIKSKIPSSALSSPHGITIDTSGNIYIADINNNRVLKETRTSQGYTESVVASTGLNKPTGVAVDQSGNVFIVDSVNGRILKETLANGTYTESVIVSSGLFYPFGIAVDTSENLYITDSGNARVLKETYSNGTYTESYIMSGPSWPDGIAVSKKGKVYVTEPSNQKVVELTPQGSTYSITQSITLNIAQPHGVAVDAQGVIYIADSGNNSILRVDPSVGYGENIILSKGLDTPQAIATDIYGNLFYNAPVEGAIYELNRGNTDFGTISLGSSSDVKSLIFTLNTSGSIGSTTVSMQGISKLDFTDAGTGTCATNGPEHVYAEGDICTVDVIFSPKYPNIRTGASVLHDADGNIVSTAYISGTGLGAQIAFSPGQQSLLSLDNITSPIAVAVDGANNIYIAQAITAYSSQNAILKATWSSSGYTLSTIASGFVFPTDLAIDGAGNIYVVDMTACINYKLTLQTDGTYKKTYFNSVGTAGAIAVDAAGNVYEGDGGIGVQIFYAKDRYNTSAYVTQSRYASGLAIDQQGNVFIVQGSIKMFKESLTNTGYSESTIDLGIDPIRVVIDGRGNLYLTGNNSIIKETPSNGSYVSTTLASGLEGIIGIALDQAGNVYASSTKTNKIWKFDYATPPSLSFASTAYGYTSQDSPQSITITNKGNDDLVFPALSSGSNPSLSSGFALSSDESTTCSVPTNSSSTSTSLASDKTCAFSIAFTPVSTGMIQGTFSLTDNSLGATSPSYASQSISLTGAATKSTSTLSLSSSSSLSLISSPITFTANLTAHSGTPTGAVSFYDGSSLLGSAQLVSGIATYTTSSLSLGSHSITATYAADSNFTSATSSATTVYIDDFSIGSSNSGSTSAGISSSGGQATFTIPIAPANGTSLGGAITFSISGLPTGATAVFSPSSIPAGASATNVTLTISMPSQTASSTPNDLPCNSNPPYLSLAIFLLPFARRSLQARWVSSSFKKIILSLVMLGIFAGIMSCSKQNSHSTTATSQIYPLTVTASSGSLSRTMQLTLTVK
jgi:sugar lactone lactonase YvrE